MNVVIVDDSKIIAERLREMLTDLSNDIRVVQHAQNPAEGKWAIHSASPDVVILDIRMPGGTGIEVLEEAKRQHSAPVVIILTNYPLPQYRARCMKAGADYFFDKSTQFDQVPGVLQGLLHRRSSDEDSPPLLQQSGGEGR
jgi:DNA-binding NarL/FixJ family response regulator